MDLNKLIQEKDILNTQINTLNKKLKKVLDDIEIQKVLQLKLNEPESFVTDHAVIRYIERKLNVNINDLKQELVKDHINTIMFMGSGKIQTQNGTLVIQHHKIVTII